MFLIQYNLLTESTFNDTIEKVDFVGFGGKNERANFCAVTKNRTKFYVINRVLPVTRSVFGLAIAFANETMITSYNL